MPSRKAPISLGGSTKATAEPADKIKNFYRTISKRHQGIEEVIRLLDNGRILRAKVSEAYGHTEYFLRGTRLTPGIIDEVAAMTPCTEAVADELIARVRKGLAE